MDGGDWNSQQNAGGFMAGSSPAGAGGGGKGKGATDNKRVVSLTVKQLHSATAGGEGFKVDGVELSHVRVMGRLLDIHDDASSCRILLHDGTGSIQFTVYTDASEQWSVERGTWELGKYLEVVAQVKSHGGNMQPMHLVSRLVTDHNSITRHLLEVTYTHLLLTRGPLAAAGGGGGGGGGGGASAAGGYGALAAAAGYGAGGGEGSMSADAIAVLAIYKECDEEDGLSVAEAVRSGKQRGISAEVVQRATQQLQMDGMIYSTIDDTHFRAT